ncbi:MAG: hypothetical protein ABSE77_10375 [Acidimicrobiales bacterium]
MGREEGTREPRPGDPDPRLLGRQISRRVFIRGAVGSAAGLVLAEGRGLPGAWASTSRPLARATGPFLSELHLGALRPAITGAKPNLVFQAVRTEDMLYLGFEFYNAHAEVLGGQVHIVPTDTTKPTYMVVVFPSQHLGEQSVEYTPGVTTWPSPPLHGALAGFSWLAFELALGASVPYTLQGLLDWTTLRPQLVPVETHPATGSPAPPDPLHTAIEVPWSLWLSPGPNGTWHHSSTPVTFSGRTELWHTRLGVKGLEPPLSAPLLKAFWSRTYGEGTFAPPAPDPWFMPLDPTDRNDIVSLTTSRGPGGGPVTANFFALTALGASINVQGHWSPGPNDRVSLESWIHRTSVGRDSYVRVVNLGYLFPFGHRAVKIKVTDREFQVAAARPSAFADAEVAEVVAYLVTKEYIVVTQPIITYTGDTHEPFSGRGNPLRQVEVKTITTPPIDFDPSVDPGIKVGALGSDTDYVLWVRSGLADVPFSFVGTDLEGRKVDFTASVIWVDLTRTDQSDVTQVISAYDAASPSRNSPSLGGQLIAFADTAGAKPGATAQHVENYTLTAKYVYNGAANFYPLLSSAVVHLPSAEQIVGAGSAPLSPPSVSISDNYVNNGFQTGVTEVYLAVKQNGPSLNFPVNLVGGMAAPNFGVSGIARDLGPVGGDLTNLLAGKFDPSDFFGNLSGTAGKLLGAISIVDIITAVDPDEQAANDQAPQISSNFVYPNNDDTQPPTAIDTKLNWNPTVEGDSLGFFQPNSGGQTTNLLVTAEIYTPISNPAQTTYSVHGELTNFELVLFGSDASFIGITFNSFTFDSKTGAKTSVQPNIDTVTFLGPLTFIQDLSQLLSSLGGPSIDVSSAGIDASYTLALPDITVGIFSLTNLSLSAGVNIPFDGTPVRVRFSLCTQDNPFLLTIYVFGGGGFFGLAIGADGIEEIQVSLEFGAAISINLGVASGGVSIMAGIYFSLQTVPQKQVQLTGFLRADGNLSVLGIIQISMEFYLAFTYLDPGQCYGTATVSLSISVLFFSVSVSATMTKTFGGGSDPDFADAITQGDWDTYCGAFAS